MDRVSFVQQKQEEARAFFRQGYNCSQSVLLAFSDLTGLDDETSVKVGAGLGGGVSRMREVCGAVSAMAVVCGFIECKSTYALVQQLASEFRSRNGSVVCRDLLALKSSGWQTPERSARTPEFYSSRPCERMVMDSAGIIAGYLFDNKIKP